MAGMMDLGLLGGLLKGLADPSNLGKDLTQGLVNGLQDASAIAGGGAGMGSNPLTALSGSDFDDGGMNQNQLSQMAEMLGG